MLSNIRVLDLTRLLPGPFTTQLLADLGAEVIKIEEPGFGDYCRLAPTQCIDGTTSSFHSINRGKKSVTLDLKNKKDWTTFKKLLKTADVLIESFRPGVMENLKLNPEQLLQEFPSLIICRISGYGQTGHYCIHTNIEKGGRMKKKICQSQKMIFIRSGLLGLMEKPDLPPLPVADLCGGAYPAAFQIVSCLFGREKDPLRKGNIIDVSMTDGCYALMPFPQSIVNNTPKHNISFGKYMLNGSVPCYQVYECKDKNAYISLGCLEPKFWYQTCDAIQCPHLKSKGLLAMDNGGDSVKAELTKIFKTKTSQEWREIFSKYDACVEIVNLSEQVSANDPQLKARNLDVPLTLVGKSKDGQTVQTQLKVPRTPLNMKHGVDIQTKPGPKLGEHNQEILSKL
ncbi:L-carnitine dehydratase/bile acid-inducible protein F [Reticulomyxa filosa]|uniref:L-carnitine dehydratase/bile acid-inducible protein F n=1 Tax=Reticulomyxa filosa TaxID=46433 RepID=X6M8E2_RETFI|nr:L-carnitine dehydratase/bile acid-inducible protein F [Reticulomyxa filosa]|eukprot:ETO10189.1 L-carnitine dehydratase/bile acid-inducible protein F [Reticulomyxa filosa]